MYLKAVALAALASTLISTASFAADPVMDMPNVYDWSGFYVGGHVGYGFGDIDSDQLDAVAGTSVDIDVDGYLAGAHIGYDYQIGNVVIGAFGDIDYFDLDVDLDVPGAGIDGPIGDVDGFIARAEVKLGYAMDTTLVYAHGGFAYIDGSIESALLPAAGLTSVDFDETGYVVGAGVSQAFSEKFVGSFEYAYHKFDDLTLEANDVSLDTDADLDIHVLKAKLSYRF